MAGIELACELELAWQPCCSSWQPRCSCSSLFAQRSSILRTSLEHFRVLIHDEVGLLGHQRGEHASQKWVHGRTEQLGEPIRMLLEFLNVDFEDERLEEDWSKWYEMKYKLDIKCPNLPYLIDGKAAN